MISIPIWPLGQMHRFVSKLDVEEMNGSNVNRFVMEPASAMVVMAMRVHIVHGYGVG